MSFKILSPVQKVLKRPARVIGDIKTTEHQKYTFSNTIKNEIIQYNPGLGKIIREIIDNSIDEFIRTEGKFSDKIDIVISDDGYITVRDNGRGIPIKMTHDHEGREILIPEAAWTRIDAGSNFDDDATNQTAGQNGEGAALTNIFSIDFKGETTNISEKNSQTFTLHCTNNLSSIKTDVKETKKQNGTIVKFLPDYERFGVKELPKGNIDVLNFELLHIGMTYPGIKFTINGTKLQVRNLKEYAELYSSIYELSDNTGLKIVVMPSSSDNFEYVHFINGLNVFNGGTPMNWVTDNIVSRIYDKLVKKYKSITKGDIKSKLFIVSIFNGMYNPRFADQIKSQCVNNFTDFKSQIELPDFEKLVAKILKSPAIIDPITEVYKIKEELKKRQELKNADKQIKKPKSEKFMPPIGEWINIFLAEGDSASNSISKIIGRQGNGFYAMFGVPPNAYDMDIKDIIASKKMTDLQQILGLQFSKTTQENINFKYIIITTDFDLPGHFIAGQLFGLFYRFGKNLFEEHRIKRLITPLIVVKDSKEKIVKWFYSFDEYRNFELENANKKYSYEYKKGLGSWDQPELEYIIEKDGLNNMLEVMTIEDSSELIDDWLSDKKADKRKEMLEGYEFNIMNL